MAHRTVTNRSAVQAVRSRILAPVTDSPERPQLPPAMADARSLVAALLAEGVREVVLCPGSRSAPLAEALADAADGGAAAAPVQDVGAGGPQGDEAGTALIQHDAQP